jgi:hypothetical protein
MGDSAYGVDVKPWMEERSKCPILPRRKFRHALTELKIHAVVEEEIMTLARTVSAISSVFSHACQTSSYPETIQRTRGVRVGAARSLAL